MATFQSAFYGTMAGQYDALQEWLDLSKPPLRLHPVYPRHLQVDNRHIKMLLFCRLDSFLAGESGLHCMALFEKALGQVFEQSRFIVYQ